MRTVVSAMLVVLLNVCVAHSQIFEKYGIRKCRSKVPVGDVYILTKEGWLPNTDVSFKKLVEAERRIPKKRFETPYLIKIEAELGKKFKRTDIQRAEIVDCRTGEVKKNMNGSEATQAYNKFYSSRTVSTPELRNFNYSFRRRGFWFFRCGYTGNFGRHFLYSNEGEDFLAEALNLKVKAHADSVHEYRKSILVPINADYLNSTKMTDRNVSMLERFRKTELANQYD